ncbi:hypothetical protein [Candidatus Solirubrobacter pratensis]|uniref:hypothetical protein n=1 Tax=Candidatus Solirubrobacter pratensis TaxID=1298857 RepID=UPI00042777E7|nr:hypothetical protein [Candidatus Solirubrobacter pratensis]
MGICAAAALVLVVLAATTNERRAFTLGVVPAGPVMSLAPTGEVCQAPVALPDGESDFDRVAFVVGTVGGRPGPQLDVTLATTGGTPVAHGRVPGRYAFSTRPIPEAVSVGHVTSREPLRVCLRNAGSSTVAIFGNGDLASRTSTAALNGKPLGIDVALSFEHAKPRSALSILPALFDRAALWRAGWIGGWTYWLLGAVVLLAVPALMVVALRGALDDH